MSMNSSINNLIGTFSNVTAAVDSNNLNGTNLICIDTSNNRLGINTLDPSHAIHVVDVGESLPGTIKVHTIQVDKIMLRNNTDSGTDEYKEITMQNGVLHINN